MSKVGRENGVYSYTTRTIRCLFALLAILASMANRCRHAKNSCASKLRDMGWAFFGGFDHCHSKRAVIPGKGCWNDIDDWAMPCPAQPCLALSGLAAPCLAPPCLAWPCLVSDHSSTARVHCQPAAGGARRAYVVGEAKSCRGRRTLPTGSAVFHIAGIDKHTRM